MNIASQSNQLLSVALNGGAFAYGDNKIGPSIGIDIEARQNNFGLFLSSTDNFLFTDNGFRIIEFSIGPRWYIGNLKKLSGTVETGLGYYLRGDNSAHYGRAFGINLGSWVELPLDK